jgi:UDP-N-acetylmuramate: L-alanyl-gamma-D-glutamyl-meso-diaminopimelate ligase
MKLHLIGIGGTGMGSVAGLLKAAGHDVRGSDEKVYPPMSEQLKTLGVPIFEGFSPTNLDWKPDRVVVGNVCTKDHVEVVEAQKRGLLLTSFPAILEELFLPGRHSVVVAGTHGKTTTASVLAHLLVDKGRDPSFLIGGVPLNFGAGWRLGKAPLFVVEGDEYDTAFFDKESKFLHYKPRSVILTSVELDHIDIFASMEAVRAAFAKLVRMIPADGLLLVAASSPEAVELAKLATCRVETYAAGGRSANGQPLWHAQQADSRSPTRTAFTITRGGEYFGTFEVGLVGEHNVENTLAVVAMSASLGLGPAEIAQGLSRFLGVKRRQELRGVAAGVSVIDDYGHHPTAIRETLAALRRRNGRGKLIALYEPRSATSRRSVFQKEFAEALAGADEVVVTALHAPEKIPQHERFDPERLAADLRGRGTAARMITDVNAIVDHVDERVQPGDCVVVFSSGAFGGIHDKLLTRLGDAIVPASTDDLKAIRTILDRTGVGSADITGERWSDFNVVRDESGVVGCVALEMHEDAGILRSLAVVPERRGRGFGWMLADSAVARARAAGLRRLYLLTESASDFFAEKLGFHPVDRATIDQGVANSRHFRESKGSAVAMRLDL